MSNKRRYFEEGSAEGGVTSAQLSRLSVERQWDFVRYWFKRNFENPANETPHPEGEYLYVWGGPYDALEQLQEEFPEIPFNRLQRFARRLEAEEGVIEWAPGPEHPDHQRAREEFELDRLDDDLWDGGPADLEDLVTALQAGLQTKFGSQEEVSQRAAILERLDALDAVLAGLSESLSSPGIGHNNPPPDVVEPTVVNISLTVVVQMQGASSEIRSELAKPEPDALVVAEKTSTLRKLLVGIAFGIAGGLATGAATVVSKDVVTKVMANHPDLTDPLVTLTEQVLHWLHFIT